MAALALYRTYRPGTLAEVIGQDHVTRPLSRALTSGRIHHAYLFSGPRGCGKTSTARILARSLNCESGPTPTPCGNCQSCVDLAPNGPGSMDVVELDAATHRGIDDAKDLRERAIYAPAFSQFRIYILDEAHQLTPEAANALLKLIEEPPAHLRFIFATTEPDRIIPTMRSRTFHYGFRLVPARVLIPHMAAICEREGVPAETAALAAVARAGGGSVRDSLSLLGQLLAGAGSEGLTLGEATVALGLTDGAVVDDFVAAVATGSASEMFSIVDRVVSAGHDPRRFAGDLLDRMRDLIVLQADPAGIEHGLIDVAAQEAGPLLSQAQSMGQVQLSRVADLLSAGISELKGATAPRLQLELLCARLALPTTARDPAALAARVEALERGWAQQGLHHMEGSRPNGGEHGPSSPRTGSAQTLAPAAPSPSVDHAPPDAHAARREQTGPATDPSPVPAAPVLRTTRTSPAREQAEADPVERSGESRSRQAGAEGSRQGGGETRANRGRRPSAPANPSPDPVAGRADAPAGTEARSAAHSDTTAAMAELHQHWAAVLDRLAMSSRVAWTLFRDAVPLSVGDGTLCLAVSQAGYVMAISAKGHDERLRQAIIDVAGLDLQVSAVHDPGASTAPASRVAMGETTFSAPGAPAADSGPSGASSDRASASPSAERGSAATAGKQRAAAARVAATRGVEQPADEPSPDDPDLGTGGSDGLALITRELGGRPIGEIDHS